MREGWEYKKFDEVFNLQMGKTPDRKNPDYFGGKNVWISIRDLGDKEVFQSNEHITDKAVSDTNIRKVKKGTVIMSFKLTVGKCGIAAKDLYTNEAIMAFNTKEDYDINSSFLYYYLQCYNWKGSNKAVMGITLNKATISKQHINIPPKSTQLAIASELDKINELIRLKKEQLKDFDNLAQSIFYEMFGDPVENEMGWEVKKLGDSIKVIGGYAFCSKNFLKSGIPVLRIGNINTGKFTPTNMVYWQKDKELSRYRILPGDLVISLTGTVGKSDYGNVCILGNDYEEYYLNQRNAKLEVGSNLNKYFLTYLLKQDMIRKKLTGINRGVRQANIANRDIENLNIPLPPLPLQHLFAQRIEQIEHQKAEVQKAIADLETLLASRMQYWFE